MKKITLDGVDYALIPVVEIPPSAPNKNFDFLLDVFEVGMYIGKKFYYASSTRNPPPVYTVTGVSGNNYTIVWKSAKGQKCESTIVIRELIHHLKTGYVIEVKEEVKKERDWTGTTFKTKNNYSSKELFTILEKHPINGVYDINYFDLLEKCTKRMPYTYSNDYIQKRFDRGDWKEVKKITTLPDENGKMIDIYDGDYSYTAVDSNTSIRKNICINKNSFVEGVKYFATEAAAKQELERTKKKYSEEDIKNALNKDEFVSFYTHYKRRILKELGIQE